MGRAADPAGGGPSQLLVYGAAPQDVADVWVDGRRVVADGRLSRADEEAIVQVARESAAELATSAGLEGLSLLAERPVPTAVAAPDGDS